MNMAKTKEEILEPITTKGSYAERYIFEAMDEYARQEAIGFAYWKEKGGFWYDDETDLWNQPDFGEKSEIKYTEDGQFRFTTEELYSIYLSSNPPQKWK